MRANALAGKVGVIAEADGALPSLVIPVHMVAILRHSANSRVEPEIRASRCAKMRRTLIGGTCDYPGFGTVTKEMTSQSSALHLSQTIVPTGEVNLQLPTIVSCIRK